MVESVKWILREIGKASQKLKEELPVLRELLREINEVEAITQNYYIILPARMTRITEYRESQQNKMAILAENFERAKTFIAEVETRAPIPSKEMLEDLRILATYQQYKIIKINQVAPLLKEISEAIERVRPKVVLIERRFKEQVGITITSPQKGETLRRGTIFTFKWTSIGPKRDYVGIFLLKNEYKFREITPETPNTGICGWPIPASLPPGDDYQISIRQVRHNEFLDNVVQNPIGRLVYYPDANVCAISCTFEIR
ncbi:MAG: hypothetical protein FJW63_00385 [Actinobacteria bacterium]|nr:hypothetical protein [Actinomycetota bacterium]